MGMARQKQQQQKRLITVITKIKPVVGGWGKARFCSYSCYIFEAANNHHLVVSLTDSLMIFDILAFAEGCGVSNAV